MRELEEELWEILDEADVDLLITMGEDGFPYIRPMTLLAYEEDTGVLWFATSRISRKVSHIQRNPKVTAFFLAFERDAYAAFFGEAELLDDPKLKREFWEDDWAEHWDGPEDPDYVLLRIRSKKAQFYLVEEDELWETEFD
ncbi:hypothetical protein DRJ58_00330 [Candidatus Acetothermia bacterium]|nr:MAG: hypothetical protein DRJ58_00330 [Candidatus Acetothermia bacterium]